MGSPGAMEMDGLRGATLTVRFLCELGALAALGYWGFHVGEGGIGFVLGIAAPALAAVVWGLFVAPKAKHRIRLPARLAIELLVFGAATAALVAAGLWASGAVLGALALVSSLLNASQERRGSG